MIIENFWSIKNAYNLYLKLFFLAKSLSMYFNKNLILFKKNGIKYK